MAWGLVVRVWAWVSAVLLWVWAWAVRGSGLGSEVRVSGWAVWGRVLV